MITVLVVMITYENSAEREEITQVQQRQNNMAKTCRSDTNAK